MTVRGHENRVLPLGRGFAVLGDHGPLVRQQLDVAFAGVDHVNAWAAAWLDEGGGGEEQPGHQREHQRREFPVAEIEIQGVVVWHDEREHRTHQADRAGADQPEEANRVFNEYNSIGYEMDDIMLQPAADGGIQLSGTIKNNTAEQGSTVTLRFHFGDADGQELGSTDIRVQLPAPEESVQFSGTFNSSERVTGYTYEVVQ